MMPVKLTAGSGQGPTLMTEYEEYGARHFLRRLDPEGASELRYRFDYLTDGTMLAKTESADIDRLRLDGSVAEPFDLGEVQATRPQDCETNHPAPVGDQETPLLAPAGQRELDSLGHGHPHDPDIDLFGAGRSLLPPLRATRQRTARAAPR